MRGLRAMNEAERNADFMLASVVDTEGTIRATDTKASIALVLHGLLFSGLISVTERIGPTYDAASAGFHIPIVALLGIALCSALASVVCLLLCVAPAPLSALPELPKSARGLFFVNVRAKGRINPGVGSVDSAYFNDVKAMNADSRLRHLTGEVLALSSIRARKTTLVRRGLTLLGIEFVASLACLAVIGAHVA
jgi:Family of unknown function (DUF5706)